MSSSARPSTVSHLVSFSFCVWPQARAYTSLSGCRAEVDEEGVTDGDGQGKE